MQKIALREIEDQSAEPQGFKIEEIDDKWLEWKGKGVQGSAEAGLGLCVGNPLDAAGD